ncbi:hypothetical protein WBG78_29360 [Chryseolinea sp. T2]|uniref:hypothetical protein n=1 Tax=Chryseolinea sp. T2 TaxID=3129255 RepID=UPI0030771E9B
MKKLVMLVLICASIFTYNHSYASGDSPLPSNKSAKSTKTHTATKTNSKVRNVKRNKSHRGYNYYRYANSHAYLRSMGKAINGR